MADFRNTGATDKGLRDNNPLNINAAGWKGQIGVDGKEAIFSDTVYGFRAAAYQLLKYYNSYGLTTINEIIATWAPAVDGNDPVSYAANVAASMGIGVDDQLTMDAGTLKSLMIAMMPNEILASSVDQIDQSDIDTAINMLNLPAVQIIQSANGYGGILLLSGIFLILLALSEKK